MTSNTDKKNKGNHAFADLRNEDEDSISPHEGDNEEPSPWSDLIELDPKV